jgi:hypothetical protein
VWRRHQQQKDASETEQSLSSGRMLVRSCYKRQEKKEQKNDTVLFPICYFSNLAFLKLTIKTQVVAVLFKIAFTRRLKLCRKTAAQTCKNGRLEIYTNPKECTAFIGTCSWYVLSNYHTIQFESVLD